LGQPARITPGLHLVCEILDVDGRLEGACIVVRTTVSTGGAGMLDVEARVGIVEGRMVDQQDLLRELAQSLRQFEARVDARFAAMDLRFGDVDGRLTGLDRRMDALGIEMTALRRDMTMQLTSQFRWTTGIVISGLIAIVAAVLAG
jgi:hypothetical protein